MTYAQYIDVLSLPWPFYTGNDNIYFVQSLQNEDRMAAEFCVGCPEDEKNVFARVNKKFLGNPSWGGHTDTSAKQQAKGGQAILSSRQAVIGQNSRQRVDKRY